jgi:hypothetical protein
LWTNRDIIPSFGEDSNSRFLGQDVNPWSPAHLARVTSRDLAAPYGQMSSAVPVPRHGNHMRRSLPFMDDARVDAKAMN